jgi:Uma2 family endonuclease
MVADVQQHHTQEMRRRLFTIEEFDQLWEAGILKEGERVEFLDGELIAMSTVGGPHVRTINRVVSEFIGLGDRTLEVSVQNPLRIGDRASFLPDVAILRVPGPSNHVPLAEEVLLVMEIADSSRSYDRNTKFPRYAAAGIPEAWLLDLVAQRIERHTEPGESGYARIVLARRGERLRSTVIPALTLDVATILGLPPEE